MKQFKEKKLRRVLTENGHEILKLFIFWFSALAVWEITLYATVFSLSARMLYGLFFTMSIAAFLTFLTAFGNSLFNRIARLVLLILLFLVYAVQIVYYKVFDTLLSITLVSMGDEAITTFMPTVLRAIRESALQLVILALPILAFIVLHKRKILDFKRRSDLSLAIMFLLSIALFCLGYSPIWSSGVYAAPGSIYNNSLATVDSQASYFGLLTAERLDIARTINGSATVDSVGLDLTDGEAGDKNIIDAIDFEALNGLTTDENILDLNDYFAGLSGTSKNEYTGYFEGYNVIEFCAEAFSSYLVDPEITPTLYKLTHEGFVFENFYCSFPNMTANGEYSLCTGLMPDRSRISLATSMDNYLPYCLGRELSNQGAVAYAYHNNSATYYNRINTHTNMGYTFKAIGFGLDMDIAYPASDLEMLEKTVDDYINADRFVVHYMTYSGHAEYSLDSNMMSIKNRDRVMDMDCSDQLKAYYACQLELEDALTYLLDRLEDAGIADRTVIVLTGDHYPYGLSEETYKELAGDAVDEDRYWQYENDFVCWSASMEEPIYVDDYCCTQDILPTLLNLLGINYDSRLMTGMDVLSDSTHIALLYDGSFLCDALDYYSDTGEITWKEDPDNYPDGYAEELVKTTSNEFSVAAAILRTDYYRFAYSKFDLIHGDETTEHYTSFSDTVGEWYEDDVEVLTARGVLTGWNGIFSGSDNCQRADYLTMLSRAVYLDADTSGGEPYSDVDPWNECYEVVCMAWHEGLLESSVEWHPWATVTLDEAKELLLSFAEYVGIENAETWVESTAFHVSERAVKAGESLTSLSRGTASALVAELVRALEEIEAAQK